jgi:hypothetical protein
MLGRKAAVAVSMLVLAVTGGSAYAATHGSSHSTKPQTHKVVRVHHVARTVVVTPFHHCHHTSGGSISAASL